MNWKTVNRPGYFGRSKDRIHAEYNERYGEGNWRTAWQFGRQTLEYLVAVQLYEDGYYNDSFSRSTVWNELVHTARDVWDYEESDILSKFDYSVQNGPATHLQDIAIRRVVMRRGWEFEGDQLVRIRHHNTYWGSLLSPGMVPFHLPGKIVQPPLKSWWQPGTIEDFWQSNKVLQIIDYDSKL